MERELYDKLMVAVAKSISDVLNQEHAVPDDVLAGENISFTFRRRYRAFTADQGRYAAAYMDNAGFWDIHRSHPRR